jgi:hypothetical protein
MGHAEPDIAELFAPLRPAQASDVVLNEARQVLSHVQRPIDAELWGSDMIGALAGAGPFDKDFMTELTVSLVPAVEKKATPEALGLLRVLGAIGTPELKAAATEAAERVTAQGVPDPDWAAAIGSPTIGQCWHYSDVGGRQESITVSFGYGDSEHALSVLIDHGKSGKIKDAWVDDAEGLLDKTWMPASARASRTRPTTSPRTAPSCRQGSATWRRISPRGLLYCQLVVAAGRLLPTRCHNHPLARPGVTA